MKTRSKTGLLVGSVIGVAIVVGAVVWQRLEAGRTQTGPSASAAAPAAALATAPALAPAAAPAAGAAVPASVVHPEAQTVLLARTAYAACDEPAEPAAPPDGASASREQMVVAHEAEKRYDGEVTNYLNCVDAATTRLTEQFNTSSPGELDAVRQLGLTVHNAAIERAEAVVDKFNRQLRVYKVRQRS